MLSLEEMKGVKINPDVAREAYEQAEKRLADALQTKSAFEQKAFTLFGGYTTVSFALVGVAGSMFEDDGLTRVALALGLSGIVLIVGALLLVLALRDRTYGALGSNPDMWLRRDTIDGVDGTLPLMLAYITFHHQKRIKESIKSNNSMAALIRWAIYAGLSAPIVAAVTAFTPLADCLQTFL